MKIAQIKTEYECPDEFLLHLIELESQGDDANPKEMEAAGKYLAKNKADVISHIRDISNIDMQRARACSNVLKTHPFFSYVFKNPNAKIKYALPQAQRRFLKFLGKNEGEQHYSHHPQVENYLEHLVERQEIRGDRQPCVEEIQQASSKLKKYGKKVKKVIKEQRRRGNYELADKYDTILNQYTKGKKKTFTTKITPSFTFYYDNYSSKLIGYAISGLIFATIIGGAIYAKPTLEHLFTDLSVTRAERKVNEMMDKSAEKAKQLYREFNSELFGN